MWGLREPGWKCICCPVSLALPWRKRELEIKEFFVYSVSGLCPPRSPGQNQALGL